MRQGPAPVAALADAAFASLARDFPVQCASDEFFNFPRASAALGHMDRLDNLDAGLIAGHAAELRKIISRLRKLRARNLEDEIDAETLELCLERLLTEFELKATHRCEPQLYLKTAVVGVNQTLAKHSAGKEQRQEWIWRRLNAIPELLRQGRTNLAHARDNAKKASLEMLGQCSAFLGADLLPHLEAVFPALHWDRPVRDALAALEKFRRVVERLPGGAERLGEKEILEHVLRRHYGCRLSLREIYDLARQEEAEVLGLLEKTSLIAAGTRNWRQAAASLTPPGPRPPAGGKGRVEPQSGVSSSAQGAAASLTPPGPRPPAGGKGRVEPQSGVSSSAQGAAASLTPPGPRSSAQGAAASIEAGAASGRGLLELYGRETRKLRAFFQKADMPFLLKGPSVRVAETPRFLRALRVSASYNSPLSPHPKEPAHFYITPLEPGASSRQRLENMRHVHNEAIFTSAHETYPGHHSLDAIRLRHSNPVRRQIESPFFYEGWACYAESWIADLGYLQDPRQEILLLKRRLWRSHRALIDVGLRSGRLRMEDARRLLEKLGFSRRKCAQQVERYTLTAGYQLCYFLGCREILKLRRKFQPRLGRRRFHELLLNGGQIPFSCVEKRLGPGKTR